MTVPDADRTLRLAGDQVIVRSVADADHAAIEAVMRSPGVRFWWWDFDIDGFTTKMLCMSALLRV